MAWIGFTVGIDRLSVGQTEPALSCWGFSSFTSVRTRSCSENAMGIRNVAKCITDDRRLPELVVHLIEMLDRCGLGF